MRYLDWKNRLRRSGVVRFVVLYVSVAVVVFELAEIVAPRVGIPNWIVDVIVQVGVAGLFVSLIILILWQMLPYPAKNLGFREITWPGWRLVFICVVTVGCLYIIALWMNWLWPMSEEERLKRTLAHATWLAQKHQHLEARRNLVEVERLLSGHIKARAQLARMNHILLHGEHVVDGFRLDAINIEASFATKSKAEAVFDNVVWGVGPDWYELLGIRDLELARRFEGQAILAHQGSEDRDSGAIWENALEHVRSARRNFAAAGKLTTDRAMICAAIEAIILRRLDRRDEAQESMGDLQVMLRNHTSEDLAAAKMIVFNAYVSIVINSQQFQAMEVNPFAERSYVAIGTSEASTDRDRILSKFWLAHAKVMRVTGGYTDAEDDFEYLESLSSLIKKAEASGLEGIRARLQWQKVKYIQKISKHYPDNSTIFRTWLKEARSILLKLQKVETIPSEQVINIDIYHSLLELITLKADETLATTTERVENSGSDGDMVAGSDAESLRIVIQGLRNTWLSGTDKQRKFLADDLVIVLRGLWNIWNPTSNDWDNYPERLRREWTTIFVGAISLTEEKEPTTRRFWLKGVLAFLSQDTRVFRSHIMEIEEYLSSYLTMNSGWPKFQAVPEDQELFPPSKWMLSHYLVLTAGLAKLTDEPFDYAKAAVVANEYSHQFATDPFASQDRGAYPAYKEVSSPSWAQKVDVYCRNRDVQLEFQYLNRYGVSCNSR